MGVFDGLMEEMRGLRETLERGPGRVPARHYSRFASQSTGVWAKIDLEAQVPPRRRQPWACPVFNSGVGMSNLRVPVTTEEVPAQNEE